MAERRDLKRVHLYTMFLCTLQRPCKALELEPVAFIYLC